jgi:hypothetical protein
MSKEYVSYEVEMSRRYLIQKLRKLIKEWHEEYLNTETGWGDEYGEGKAKGKSLAAFELEKLLFNLPPEL